METTDYSGSILRYCKHPLGQRDGPRRWIWLGKVFACGTGNRTGASLDCAIHPVIPGWVLDTGPLTRYMLIEPWNDFSLFGFSTTRVLSNAQDCAVNGTSNDPYTRQILNCEQPDDLTANCTVKIQSTSQVKFVNASEHTVNICDLIVTKKEVSSPPQFLQYHTL